MSCKGCKEFAIKNVKECIFESATLFKFSVFDTFLYESSHASCLLHPSISVHLCLNLLSENCPAATLHDVLLCF